MKRKIMSALLAFAFSLAIAASCPIKTTASPGEFLHIVRCTCYCEPGLTYSGSYTYEGIIAGRKEDLGKVAALYAITEDGGIGEFIGYFEFKDTGAGMDTDGDGKGDTIKNGKSVDVYRNTLDEAKDWVKKYGDYVIIKIIEAEG